MAAPKAPLLGGAKKEVSLDEAVFAAEIKPHLVHEAVRAELNARRQGTRAAKSRGLVSGGRAKPWRQKGTGRARQGTIRAPQFAGGGVAFPPTPRDFSVKVNKKALRPRLRAALSDHAQAGTLGLVAGDSFDAPSTKQAVELLQGWGQDSPTVVVASEDEETLDQVVPQPAAGARDGSRRARGRARRLGALARRDARRRCRSCRGGPHEPPSGAGPDQARREREELRPDHGEPATRSRCTRTRTRRRSARPSRSSSTSRS